MRDRPKTVIHVITRLSLGGSAMNTLDSAAAAARAGYRTVIVAGPAIGENGTQGSTERRGCELESVSGLTRSPSPLRDLLALGQLLRLFRRYRVDIVHTHTSKAGFLGRVAAFLAGVPVVIHTSHGHVFYGYYGRALTTLFVTLERFAARLTDYLVFLTDGEAEEHRELGIGRPESYVTIPSGIDLEALRARAPSRDAARRSLAWPSDGGIVLGIGRLVPVKGFDLLVRAMPAIVRAEPATRLVLVGDGPERRSLETLAARLGIAEQVTFTGASSEVSTYLAAADLLVAPSRNEGQGRVLVEAMSLGLTVVGTRVGGIPSVLRDGECGVLVPPESPEELARAVVTLLRDGDLRRSYGAEAVRQSERFSLKVMESELLALYRRATAEKAIEKPSRAELLGR